MKFMNLSNLPMQLLRAAMALGIVLTLHACGGSGTTPITDVTTTPSGLRPLPAQYTARKAVSYSPYRSTTTNAATHATEVITDAMVEQDLRLLVAGGIGLIRLFESSDVAVTVMRVISTKHLDLKVHQGIYIQSGNEAFSADQIARGVSLAKSYPDIILAVSVGNETMVNWSTTPIAPAVMVQHLNYVRSQITQPITTDDNWAFYGDAPRIVLDAIDFASVHTYSMVDTHYLPTKWDWKQLAVTDLGKRAAAMMDAAMGATRSDYQVVRDYLDTQGYKAMPVVIGETGWTAVDASGASWYRYLAHPANQKMYFDRLQSWANEGKTGAGPQQVIYFEAFDEPWKGADDKWGLFNVQRQPRMALQGLHENGSLIYKYSDTVSWNWNWEGAPCTGPNAVYFLPPTVHTAVSQNRYVIYSESTTASDFNPTGLRWDPFVSTFWKPVADAAPGDGTQSYEIDPRPESWGWGMLYQSPATCAVPSVSENLSGFASGTINFSVKTSYAGKIEVGVSSDTELDGGVESYLQIANGQYGYCNTGAWCKVSIPVQEFVKANPKLDLRLILSRFVIADRFDYTKNTVKTGQPKILLDGVYWSK